MPKIEKAFLERVDDAILAACWQLSKLRQQSIYASIADFRQTSIENRELCIGPGGYHFEDFDIWALRIDRCQMMLEDQDIDALRRRARAAAAAEGY